MGKLRRTAVVISLCTFTFILIGFFNEDESIQKHGSIHPQAVVPNVKANFIPEHPQDPQLAQLGKAHTRIHSQNPVLRTNRPDTRAHTMKSEGSTAVSISVRDHAVPGRTLQTMTYWKRSGVNSYSNGDTSWIPKTREGKYLLMVFDRGGFNNIRLQFETIVALGMLMGRTLVVPASRPWYLLGSKQLNYENFFDMDDLSKLVPIISFKEFQALKTKGKQEILKMRSLKNAFAYPSVDAVRKSMDSNVLERALESRTLVDAAPGSNFFETDVLEVANGQWRMLATWHTHILFADRAHDLALKRLLRDHVHYRSDLYELAAKGVDELGGIGAYTSLHIRRGDFQYHETRISAQKIFDNVAPLLSRSGQTTLYISTDEHNRTFFKPFADAGYKILFWRDLAISKLDSDKVPFEWIGLLEQLVASGSNMFVATRLSTFSSYIIRVRGYLPGAHFKELYYADQQYTGDPTKDDTEKDIDWMNTKLGGGELFYFREPKSVWALD
eukprot:m.426018 g.426018  ORF g.426018 m.426018 type:complete len:499 (-) comp21350_c0_seq1:83-1579(-)